MNVALKLEEPKDPDDEPELRFIDPLPPDPRTYRKLPVSVLVMAGDIQRAIQGERVKRIANEFDWHAFDVPHVSEIPGTNTYAVSEGQHHVQALRLRDPNAVVMCAISKFKHDPQREADLAYRIAKARRPHSAVEAFLLRRSRGDAHETMALEVLEDFGLRIGPAPSSKTIAAAATVTTIIHGHRQDAETGALLLRMTLRLILDAYPKHDDMSKETRFTGAILQAVAEIVYSNSNLQDARLVKILQGRPAQQWINATIKNRLDQRPPWMLIGEKIVGEYNRRLSPKMRLSWK